MAFGNVYFYLFMALVAVNLIFAEDSQLSDANQADFTEVASRKERSPEEDAEDRFLFGIFPIITVCNYTATPGASCASCRQTLRCLSNNNGIVKYCKGLFPYCNGGYCSFIRDSSCNSTLVG